MDQINTTTTEEKEVVKEVHKIKVNPIPFDSVADVMITTTNELAKMVNEIFVNSFIDYYGCNLQVQQRQVPGGFSYVVVPVLIFKVLDKKIYENGEYEPAFMGQNRQFAFEPMIADPSKDLGARVQRIGQMGSMPGVKVKITDNGMTMLEDFAVDVPRSQTFDWKTAYTTKTTDEGTFILVYKLDLVKIITAIFGNLIDESKQYYNVSTTGVLYDRNQYKAIQNWGLQILRLDEKNERAAADRLGFFVPAAFGGTIDAITGTTTNPNR